MQPNNRFRTVSSRLFRILFLAAFALIVSACDKENLDIENTRGLAGDPYPKAPTDKAKLVRIILWQDAIDPSLIQSFENRYGIRTEITTCRRASDLLEKLASNPDGWDVIMTNDYVADYLNAKGFLGAVKRQNPFIYRYINTSVINPKGDIQMRYFVPFDYAAFGISFNTDYVAGFPQTWHYLSEHDDNPYLYGRMVISDDMRFAFSTALMHLGLDPNSTNAQDIEKARDLLILWIKKYGLRFVPFSSVPAEMKNTDALIGITWSGTGCCILRENQACRFLLPEGRTLVSLDGFCVPKTSRCPNTAALFIEFMMHPYVSMINTNYSLFASTNIRSMRFANRFVVNGPSSLIPSPENMVFASFLPEKSLDRYYAAWTEVKAAAVDPDRIKIIPVN